MRLKLITMGVTAEDWLEKSLKDFEKRLSRYCNFERLELKPPKNGAKLQAEELLKKEAEIFIENIQTSDFVVILDEKGREYTSVEWSSFIQQKMNSGVKQMVFLIGGPFGFDDSMRKRADLQLSLSKMTLTHQMVRLFFTEQLYRAFTILRGEKYHHE